MGWSVGYDQHWKRDIGYGVPAWCDHPECIAEIDRGLAYVCCNQQPYGGDNGCGLYFCETHLSHYSIAADAFTCERCANDEAPFNAKPDHPDWIQHKATDPSWAAWRAEQESL
jgi:hypothetical protein